MVSIQNNFLTPDLYKEVENYCYHADYCYGEHDGVTDQVPTGVVHDLELDSKIVSYFPSKIRGLSLYLSLIHI